MRLFWVRYASLFTAILLLFITAVQLRPLLPIDETRYLGVAWEMHLKQDWFLLTMNFEPYHHKPPLLFWLINLSWSVFGVSRWAAAIPLLTSACTSLILCHELAKRILPAHSSASDRAPLLLLGSMPFLIYSTMVMFDVTLMAVVMGTLIAMFSFAKKRTIAAMLVMGLLMGLGVLTKGPVAYLYTLPPMLLAPFWMNPSDNLNKTSWYVGCLATIVISAIPVLLWLIPTLKESDNHDFAFWLVWNQTAGRITGNFSGAHIRPFYFYILLLPLLALPWAFLPSFWHGIRQNTWPYGLRFLACWFLPVFVAFSFISGKQPHYLVPLLPAVIIAMAYLLRKTNDKVLITVTTMSLFVFITGHAIARYAVFPNYDLKPVANFMVQNPKKEAAFAGKYHGEFSFLARLTKPVTPIDRNQIDSWLTAHPNGYVILPYKNDLWPPEKKYDAILAMPYRGKSLTVLERHHAESP